jgi:gamma-glutamyltranspeptidase
VVIESRYGDEVAEDLTARGHRVVVSGALEFALGTVQLIQVDEARGCFIAASDPRGDGAALTP